MREFKFRGWSKEDKVMVYDLNSPRLIHGELKGDDNEYLLMQYTGIKDKNGKEIYEGDILRNNFHTGSGIFIGGIWEVKFGNHDPYEDYNSVLTYGWYVKSIKNTETYNLICLPADLLIESKNYCIEIISNIHESPELLEIK